MTFNQGIGIILMALAASHALADGLPKECGELAEQARYSPPEVSDWLSGLTQAFATLPNDQGELGFFNPPKYSGVTGRPLVDGARALPKQEDLDQNTQRSLRIPIKRDQYGGGSIAFGADLYPNEYFKWNFSTELPENRSASALSAWWAPITLHQPWLEWRTDGFVWHAGDAQTRLLCRLAQTNPNIHLYRGTIPFEAALLDALKSAFHAPTNQTLADKLQELVKASRLVVEHYKKAANNWKVSQAQNQVAALESLSADFAAGKITAAQLVKPLKTLLDGQMRKTQCGAFFLSSESERAKGFAKGTLVKFEFPLSALLDLNRRHLLYAGIENDIEIAFLPGIDLDVFIEGFQSSEAVEPKR